MIKKFLLTFLFAFVCFLGIDKVYAETQRIYMGYEGFQTEIGDTRNFSTTAKEFTNQITYSDITNEHDRNSNLYVRYAFCSYDSLYTSSIHINSVNTNIKCMNNDRVGTFTFFTGSYNENHLSTFTQGTNGIDTYVYNTSFNLYGTTSGSFTLYGVDVGRSLDNFPSYDSNSDVLSELDSLQDYLESSLYSLNGTANNILYYLKNIYDLFKCEEVNLLAPNGSSTTSSGITFTNNYDGTFSISGTATTSKSFSLTTTPPSLKKNTSYTLSLVILENTGSNFNVPISVIGENGDIVYNFFTVKPGSTTSTKSISRNTTINSISVYIPKDYTVNATFQVQFEEGSSASPYLPYGQCRSMIDTIKDSSVQNSQNSEAIKNSINDDDTSESSSEAQEFFEGFDTDTYGLTSIITAPLELIGNIAGSTCSPLPLEIPFVGGTFNLPCMSSIYKKHFGSFLTIYQTITFGIVSYWVCIRIFALVKDFKNPEHDEIEVMDL